jgi:MFS family permease
LINGLTYLFLSSAENIPAFIALMIMMGAAQPLYRIGGDAMVADLVPEEDNRPEAYAILRLGSNIGVALGPAIGGFLAATSYSIAFFGAAGGMAVYAFLLAFFARETLPALPEEEKKEQSDEKLGGYLRIIKDTPFMSFALAYTLIIVVASLVWVLLPVYAKQNFQIPESQYGWIATTNASMVVLFQVFVTRKTQQYSNIPVMTFGALFYTIAVGGVAFMSGFWGFWLCMVVMTVGELALVPTASTYAANLAPPDMRGRYMSIFGLSWRIAIGAGPILGGLLNDNIGPSAIWLGGAVIGAAGVLLFTALPRIQTAKTAG